MNEELIDLLHRLLRRPSVQLRKGKVVSVQTGTLTATIGAGSTQVAGIPYGAHVAPAVNNTIWLLKQRGLYIAIMKEAS